MKEPTQWNPNSIPLHPPGADVGAACARFCLGALVAGCLIALATWQLLAAREAGRKEHCANNLKTIWISLAEYENDHGHLPANVMDAKGTPLLSWRVLADEHVWYDLDFRSRMDFTLPWNNPKNATFLEHFDPLVFCCPSRRAGKSVKTDYVAVVGPGTVWSSTASGTPTYMKEMHSAGSKPPIVVVEWPESEIHWAEPRDINVDEFLKWFRAVPSRSSNHRGCILYVDAAGEVGELPVDTDPEIVRKLLMISDVGK